MAAGKKADNIEKCCLQSCPPGDVQLAVLYKPFQQAQEWHCRLDLLKSISNQENSIGMARDQYKRDNDSTEIYFSSMSRFVLSQHKLWQITTFEFWQVQHFESYTSHLFFDKSQVYTTV